MPTPLLSHWLSQCKDCLHCRESGRFGDLRLDAELGKNSDFSLALNSRASVIIYVTPNDPSPPIPVTIPTRGSMGYSMIDPPVINIMEGDGEKE